MSARSACPRPKSIASSKHCSPANSRRSRSASRCACSTRRRLARRRRALPWSRIGPKRSPSPTRATCTTAFGRRGSSPGRRSRSSSGASGAGAERHSGHARVLSARRHADQLHRRQGGAGDRPPVAVLLAILVWVLSLWLTGYVSLSSIVAVLTVPVSISLLQPGSPYTFWASVALVALIIFAHRRNISRLVAGTENRFRTRPTDQ